MSTTQVPKEPILGTETRRMRELTLQTNELGFVANAILKFEKRLARKQVAKRDKEIDLLSKYAAVIRTLDCSAPAPPQAAPPPEASPREIHTWVERRREEGASVLFYSWLQSRVDEGGSGLNLLKSAEERLRSLCADQPPLLSSIESMTSSGSGPRKRDMTTARLEMLRCYCSHLLTRSTRRKDPLPSPRSNLTPKEASDALIAMLEGDTETRIRSTFSLFDSDADGYLSELEVEAAIDAITLPLQAVTEHMYPKVQGVDTKTAKKMPSVIRYTFWDRLEVPSKRRCCFAWAEDQRQTGPVMFEVTPDAFVKAQVEYWPELGRIASDLIDCYEDARWEWHETRCKRKRGTIYGLLLYFGTVILDVTVQSF